MATEYSPELNAEVLEALQRRIREKQARDIAEAKGSAISRGIAGGSYEGRRVGAAVTTGTQATADAAIQIAIENAGRLREERLIKESQTYGTKEREASQLFSSEEAGKERGFRTSERLGSQ